ncbi:MAG: DUF1439 domain-containing protein [Rickettsiaceae bacterium]|nr:DUF1439 domain-containing protein [Rickettsiaceae bacterium]
MKKLIIALGLMFMSKLSFAFTYTLEITEDELQSKITAMMPMEKNKFFITVTLSNPDVDLSVGNNEIGIFSHVEITAPGGVKGTGRAKITGTLSYDPEKKEFFFKDPKIVSLEADKVPSTFIPKVKEIAQIAANNFLSTRPVYKLTDENLKHKLAKAALQSVKIENNQLLLELSVF